MRLTFSHHYLTLCARLVWASTCLVCVGCRGNQPEGVHGTGECSWETQELDGLDALPSGFARTPRAMLHAVTAPITGTVHEPGGKTTPATLTFSIDETSAKGLRVENGSATRCAQAGVEVGARLTVAGAPLIQGSSPASLSALGSMIRVNAAASATTDFTVSQPPRLSDRPTGPAQLFLPLTLGTDCRWTGTWRWTVPISCEGKELCSGFAEAELGTFRAAGVCAHQP